LSFSGSFFCVSREQNSEKEFDNAKNDFMRSSNTFGVHFTLRTREQNGKHPIYARVTVNKTRCELSLKHSLERKYWNEIKGVAKAKNEELKQLNSYLEEIRGKLVHHYRELLMQGKDVTAELVKDAFVGKKERDEEKAKQYSLLWLVKHHNVSMEVVLKRGTMKNYFTTEKYLKDFLKKSYHKDDVLLKDLSYEFITSFEFFIRSHPVKKNDPCTNNGTMKHLERLKKIVTWAVKNEWIDKNPFIGFQLKFKRHERGFLQVNELTAIETHDFDNSMLQKVRDLFVFSCYTGLAYIDVTELKSENIITGIDNTKWIKTSRAKTETSVNVPLLKPALVILEKYAQEKEAVIREAIFPWISNQEINRSLKIIAEVCSIKKHLTFHLARHTFATSVTLINGVPIESISKMLGHTKLSTTMIYAKVTQTKIGSDMQILQNKLDAVNSGIKMKAV
jgi:site-specific recombinase XerD